MDNPPCSHSEVLKTRPYLHSRTDELATASVWYLSQALLDGAIEATDGVFLEDPIAVHEVLKVDGLLRERLVDRLLTGVRRS